MKALVLTAYNRLEILDRPRPVPGYGEVLVHVAACGICGSDVHGMDGSTGRRLPPLIMGHEAAGIVAEVGAGVSSFSVGDRVTFDSTVYCGECRFCREGLVNLCDRREVLGVATPEFHRDGAFAEFVVVPERIIYKLPEDLPFAEAAMLEAVSVALHAVAVSEIKGGETALVVGAGMIGLLTLQATRAAGCKHVIVADMDQTRLEFARQMGASEAVHPAGMIATCKRATGGAGVDIAFEAVGRNESVAGAIDAVRKGGTVTLIGNVTPEVTLPLQKVVSRQIRLQGTAASCGEYLQAIDLIRRGIIKVQPLITAIAPLNEGAGWFDRLHRSEPGLMKIVLTPGTGAA
jgi:L-iditol 2-dehydrogenase